MSNKITVKVICLDSGVSDPGCKTFYPPPTATAHAVLVAHVHKELSHWASSNEDLRFKVVLRVLTPQGFDEIVRFSPNYSQVS